MSLVEAIMLAGGSDSGLSDESRKLIAEHVSEPLDIQVFVTPTCPHCPRAVTLAHRMAVEHPLIRATCVEATEFMDLTRRYRVTGVPKTIVNGSIEILGAVPEETFVRTVLRQPARLRQSRPEASDSASKLLRLKAEFSLLCCCGVWQRGD